MYSRRNAWPSMPSPMTRTWGRSSRAVTLLSASAGSNGLGNMPGCVVIRTYPNTVTHARQNVSGLRAHSSRKDDARGRCGLAEFEAWSRILVSTEYATRLRTLVRWCRSRRSCGSGVRRIDIKERLHRGGVVDVDARRAHWAGDPRECRTWGAICAASRRECTRQQFRGEASQGAPLAPL